MSEGDSGHDHAATPWPPPLPLSADRFDAYAAEARRLRQQARHDAVTAAATAVMRGGAWLRQKAGQVVSRRALIRRASRKNAAPF